MPLCRRGRVILPAACSAFHGRSHGLGEPTPTEADPEGIDYAFEKGANRATGGRGWADVWKRGRFAFEYKKRHANLGTALKQFLDYARALATRRCF